MENDFIRIDEEFFESLKMDSVYEYLEMNDFLVPEGYDNKLIRYYNNDDSIWFSRLNINDDESIYYFGLREEETQNEVLISLVLNFNGDVKKTDLRLNKDNLFLLCKINDNDSNIVNSLPKPYLIGKNSRYYINLGKLGEKEVLYKLEKLIKLFDFDVSLKKNIQIKNLVEFRNDNDDLEYNPIDLDVVKYNLEVLKLKNFINNQDFDDDLIIKLYDYLFVEDEDNNFKLNDELFYKSLSSQNILDLIYETISELDDGSFEEFKVKYNVKLQVFYANIQLPNKFDLKLSLNEEVVVDSDVDVVSNVVVEDIVDEAVEEVVDEVVEEFVGDIVEKDIEQVPEDVVVVSGDITPPENWVVDDVDLNEEQQELFDEFLMLKDDDWINFEAENYNISEDNKEIIFSVIKHDISIGKRGFDYEIEDIIVEYFEQFSLDGNSNSMNAHYNEIINSSFYKDLLGKYPLLDNNDIEDINLKVKLDMSSDNLDKNNLIKRFRIYFENKCLEKKYKHDLMQIDKKRYLEEFNLRMYELDEIINKAIIIVENWHENLSVFNDSCNTIFKRLLTVKLDSIRSEVRREFEMRYENKDVICSILDVSIITDIKFNSMIDEIYKDINLLLIRIDDINDDLIVRYYG